VVTHFLQNQGSRGSARWKVDRSISARRWERVASPFAARFSSTKER
jgi:hypothetical protein